jgi:predicted nucleic acid-binding protein
MPALVCADASLALKLVLEEPDSEMARSLWARWDAEQTAIIGPSLWAYEVTSVVRNRTRRGLLPADEEEAVFATLHRLPIQLLRPSGLHRRAHELARRFDRPSTYDAHYLALAEMADCPFWTADERLHNRVCAELPWVRRLSDFPPDRRRQP